MSRPRYTHAAFEALHARVRRLYVAVFQPAVTLKGLVVVKRRFRRRRHRDEIPPAMPKDYTYMRVTKELLRLEKEMRKVAMARLMVELPRWRRMMNMWAYPALNENV